MRIGSSDNEISDSISYCAKSSKYASAENYGTVRGQGGVAILWKTDLSGISEIKSILHDRICGLRVQSSDGSVILIYGVYLPARGSPEDFRVVIDDLIEIIDSGEPGAECIIAGDVNCDLGILGGSRSLRPANDRGRLFKEILDKYNLFACNLDSRATGPVDTYVGPTGSSTIDYICIPCTTVSLFTRCLVTENDPLNASDHEAVSVELDLKVLKNRAPTVLNKRLPRWDKLTHKQIIKRYSKPLSDELSLSIDPLLIGAVSNEDIDLILEKICSILLKHDKNVPTSKFRKNQKPFWNELSYLKRVKVDKFRIWK